MEAVKTVATDKVDVLDISALDSVSVAEEGIEVPIISPRTGAVGPKIRAKGSHSDRFQELLAKKRRADALREKNPVARAVAPDEAEDTSDILAEVTLGWVDMIENGVQITFSKAEAKRIYLKYPLIRGQLLDALVTGANFVKG